jgi:hypothetical protein
MQDLAPAAAEILPSKHGLGPVLLVLLGDRRDPHHLPRLLRQHVAGEVVLRVTPEGRLSCNRCMIKTIAPVNLSLSRL